MSNARLLRTWKHLTARRSETKPLIGINLDVSQRTLRTCSIEENYVQVIRKSGGNPILLPPMPDQDLDSAISALSGLVLIGGPDYSPALYGEFQHNEVQCMDDERQVFDSALVRVALHDFNLPILGICAGSQLLNIDLGGTLIQHIPSLVPQSTVEHRWLDRSTLHYHNVNLEDGSKLSSIYKTTRFRVPTSHHQAVKRLGEGLRVAARADDGVIEALELIGDRFVVGVQWHPERDFQRNQVLFQSFIEAAAGAQDKYVMRRPFKMPRHRMQ